MAKSKQTGAMDFGGLVDFLENQMSMSHIYQPLLIRSLVEAGGSATLRQLAHSFLAQDESQIIYYENRIKQMPLRVLMKHGVLSRDENLVSLNVEKLSFEQKARIKMICEKRLQEFVERKGLGLWDYRLLDSEPVPDSLRYRVLKESGGRCALCGATKKERPLDVDHIKPRSRGGKTEYENLQVLCSKCNRSKGDKDQSDFRGELSPDSDPNCPFCTEVKKKSRTLEEYGTVIAIEDKYPVAPGHALIATRRHTSDFFTMTSRERTDAENLLMILKKKISQSDEYVTGFNVGTNCGISAGQTIQHAHIHLIPRRNGDTLEPKGGVRGVIPGRMAY